MPRTTQTCNAKQSSPVAKYQDACTYVHTPKHVLSTSMKNTAHKLNSAIKNMQKIRMAQYHTHIGAWRIHVSRRHVISLKHAHNARRASLMNHMCTTAAKAVALYLMQKNRNDYLSQPLTAHYL